MGDKDLIKRVVAVGGDTLEIRQATLIINGHPAQEPFINPDGPDGMRDFGPVKIPPDNLFCMGDNRANSQDSRWWGTLPQKNAIGKAFCIFWPPTRLGPLK